MLAKTYRILQTDTGSYGHIEFIKAPGRKIYFREKSTNIENINGHRLSMLSINQKATENKIIKLPNETYRLAMDGFVVDARVKWNDGFIRQLTIDGHQYYTNENTIILQKNMDVIIITITDRMGLPVNIRAIHPHDNGVLVETEDGYKYRIDKDSHIKLVSMKAHGFYRKTVTHLQNITESEPNAIITNHYTFPPTTPINVLNKTAKDEKGRGLLVQAYMNDMYLVDHDTVADVNEKRIVLKHTVNHVPVMEQTITFNTTIATIEEQEGVLIVYSDTGVVTIISSESIKQLTMYSKDMEPIPIIGITTTQTDDSSVYIEDVEIVE